MSIDLIPILSLDETLETIKRHNWLREIGLLESAYLFSSNFGLTLTNKGLKILK